jgi:hypothetical protein
VNCNDWVNCESDGCVDTAAYSEASDCYCPSGTYQTSSNPPSCQNCHENCGECVAETTYSCETCSNTAYPQVGSDHICLPTCATGYIKGETGSIGCVSGSTLPLALQITFNNNFPWDETYDYGGAPEKIFAHMSSEQAARDENL